MPIGSLRTFYTFGEKADPGRGTTTMAYRFSLAEFSRDFTDAFRLRNVEKHKVFVSC